MVTRIRFPIESRKTRLHGTVGQNQCPHTPKTQRFLEKPNSHFIRLCAPPNAQDLHRLTIEAPEEIQVRHGVDVSLVLLQKRPALFILETHSLKAGLRSFGVYELQCSGHLVAGHLVAVGAVCHTEFYPLYLGHVIRVFETGECVTSFRRRFAEVGPQRDRTEGGEGEHVEHRDGTHLAKSGFRISAKIGKWDDRILLVPAFVR